MKAHLVANLYFDTKTGDFHELVASDQFMVDEDLGNGTGYSTFGCLRDDQGAFLRQAVFPSTILCGVDRAHGKRVGSLE